MLAENAFLPILLTLSSYEVGRAIQRKTGNSLCNPILIGAILTASMLLLLKIPVDAYQSGCAPLQYLLTPATICYALGLYEQLEKLKKQLGAILAGILCGSIVSLLSIRAMASMFFLNDVHTISLLPKSITTAIGMGLAVTFVMGIASAVCFGVNKLLIALDLGYMQTVAFILVIAGLVQFIEMFLKKSMPSLYTALGVYLPLITTNCAVLGVVLLNVQNDYTFIASVVYGITGGLGFLLAIYLFSTIRERVQFADYPKCFEGFPIALITAGLIALAFMGFSGLQVWPV